MSWLSSLIGGAGGVGSVISGISSIYNMFDDSQEDAANKNYDAQLKAYNDAKAYMNQGINANNTTKDWRYQNMMDINKAMKDTNYNAYQDYLSNVPQAQQNIENTFKGYYQDAQGQLRDQYGNAINTQETAQQNAIDALKNNYNAGDVTGQQAINPYQDAIQNRLGEINANPVINYDNDAAYAEAQRKAMEDMNQQLLARGEFNSSEGLRQNQELIRDMNLQNEQADYQRALDLANLERNKTGDISNLVSSGLNVANTGSALGNTNRQLGTSLADVYMNQGKNISNIYTGLGDKGAATTQGMGQDIANLQTGNLADNTNANQAYYNAISNLYGQQLSGGADIYKDWNSMMMTAATGQPVTRAGQNFGNTAYDNALTTANYNGTRTNNLFSNLGTIFGGSQNPATSAPAKNTTVNPIMTSPSGQTYNTNLGDQYKLNY